MLLSSPALAALGEPIERVRSELIAWGRALLTHSEPAYAAAIEEALRYLERQTCRIAVIGQVKAGKSSFINALVGRPDLLPSHVNPWTTVVTHLHFYRSQTPEESARFAFFAEDEWRRIAETGGPLRELTERLVPGFDTQLLRAQLQTMRHRAEARLGPDFATLLGQQHSYTSVSPELLARYVSAEPEGQTADAVSYSDITKSADLFFGGERTGFPLTLIDTPGTNDPLLVRDEITRQSLAAADIYVVVLTAQQPLSHSDVALLRLLRGLHKERIVIFINRIDSLRDIASDAARVVDHVAARLREEFPATQFSIVAGSALWANAALAQEAGALARVMDAPCRTYATGLGYGTPEPLLPGRTASTDAVATMLAISGLPAMMGEIGRLMRSGNSAIAIRQLATFFLQVAQSSEVKGRAILGAVTRALGEAQSTAQNRTVEVQAWRRELDQLEAARRDLEANLALYEGSLRSMVDRCATDLRLLLGRRITAFTEQQIAALTKAYRANSTPVWACDPRPLREALQSEFLRVYQFWETKLAQADDLMRTQLEAGVPREKLPDLDSMPKVIRRAAKQSPSVSALGQFVALDLSAPWWRAWWSGRPSLESRVAELRRLIRDEFEPTVEDLIEEAVAVLGERSRFASRLAQIGTLDIVNHIHQRSAELVSGLQQSKPASEMLAQLGQQQRETEASVARWSELRVGLSGLVDRCEILAQAGPPDSG